MLRKCPIFWWVLRWARTWNLQRQQLGWLLNYPHHTDRKARGLPWPAPQPTPQYRVYRHLATVRTVYKVFEVTVEADFWGHIDVAYNVNWGSPSGANGARGFPLHRRKLAWQHVLDILHNGEPTIISILSMLSLL